MADKFVNPMQPRTTAERDHSPGGWDALVKRHMWHEWFGGPLGLDEDSSVVYREPEDVPSTKERMASVAARLLCATMLIIAVGENPYSYYRLLRWVVFIVGIWSGFVFLRLNRGRWVIVFGVAAVVFNPVVPVYMKRESWAIVDVALATIMVLSLPFYRSTQRVGYPAAHLVRDSKKTKSKLIGIGEPRYREKIIGAAASLATAGEYEHAVKALQPLLVASRKDLNVIGDLERSLAQSDTVVRLEMLRAIRTQVPQSTDLTLLSVNSRIAKMDPDDIVAREYLAEFHTTAKNVTAALEHLLYLVDRYCAEQNQIGGERAVARLNTVCENAGKYLWPSSLSASAEESARRVPLIERAIPEVRRYRRLLLMRKLDAISTSSQTNREQSPSASELRCVYRRLQCIHQGIGELPPEFERGETQTPHDVRDAFDPNLLLLAFRRIRIRDNWCLDYVWSGGHHAGTPLLYARPASEPPLKTVGEFSSRFSIDVTGWAPDTRAAYLGALAAEATAEGMVEFAVLLNELPFFYWLWHSYYERLVVMPTAEQRADYIHNDDPDLPRLLRTLPEGATVERFESAFQVTMLAYKVNVGLLEHTWRLLPPHTVVGESSRVILPAKGQILF